MNISFKQYLVEVEKSQVINFANMLTKAATNKPVTKQDLMKVDPSGKNTNLHLNQLQSAKTNPRVGQQMATNLVAATKKPEYDMKIKAAPTVPHFVVDLQKDVKGLTADMLKSISKLSLEQIVDILDWGNPFGAGSDIARGNSNEFIRNLIKYKDNPKVKSELLRVMRIKYLENKVKKAPVPYDLYEMNCQKCKSPVAFMEDEFNSYVTCPKCGHKAEALLDLSDIDSEITDAELEKYLY